MGMCFSCCLCCALRARGGCQDPSPVLPVLWEPRVQDSRPAEPGVQGASPGQRLQRRGQEMYELGHPDVRRSSLPADTGTLWAAEESTKMLPSEKRKKKRWCLQTGAALLEGGKMAPTSLRPRRAAQPAAALQTAALK